MRLTLWALNQQLQDPDIHKKGSFCPQNGGRDWGWPACRPLSVRARTWAWLIVLHSAAGDGSWALRGSAHTCL